MCKYAAYILLSLAFLLRTAAQAAEGADGSATSANYFPQHLTTPAAPQPQCQLNETLYLCNTQQCCQSQSHVLVEQLQHIKNRFHGVDSVIQKDYMYIKSIVDQELNKTVHKVHHTLGSMYAVLSPAFNSSLSQLYQIYLGNGTADDHKYVLRALATNILRATLSTSNTTSRQFPRTVKGISIFWQLNSAQRDCVVDYMIESTDFGEAVENVTQQVKDITQSVHEYMSLLGSMVRIIQKMVTAQETNNCINEIVKMQQCSLCTEKPVCSSFYKELLAKCVPQLDDLYSRWDSLMSAMSVLTLRLCEHNLANMFHDVITLSSYVQGHHLDRMIYQHGVLAYMKCVQPDAHKRSILETSPGGEEKMGRSSYNHITGQLTEEQFVFEGGDSIVKEIKVVRRSAITDKPISTTPPPPIPNLVEDLSKCRGKLGLSFPPLDLGTTTWLNITVSNINRNCWNGSAVGSYVVDDLYDTTTVQPEALAIQELDEKVCRYTSRVKEDCSPKPPHPPLNNSHHGPTLTQVFASLVASLLYCCC